jgi:hypothetical protein
VLSGGQPVPGRIGLRKCNSPLDTIPKAMDEITSGMTTIWMIARKIFPGRATQLAI